MGKACALCGRDDQPLTSEHIFGQWSEGVVKSADGHRKELWSLDRDTGERSTKVSRGVPEAMHQLEVRALCQPCNNEWGAQLEAEVAPIFEVMTNGTGGTLTEEGAEILATWAMKVTVLREYTNPKDHRYIAPSAARELHAHRVPPAAGVAIWAATSAEEPEDDWWTRSRLGYLTSPSSHEDALPPDIYYFIATFARLALFVIGTNTDVRLRQMDVDLPGHFARLWPDPVAFRWPLPVALSTTEFDTLFEHGDRFIE